MFKVDLKNETRAATELSLWLLLFLCIIEGPLPYNIQQLLFCFGAIHGKCNWTELNCPAGGDSTGWLDRSLRENELEVGEILGRG